MRQGLRQLVFVCIPIPVVSSIASDCHSIDYSLNHNSGGVYSRPLDRVMTARDSICLTCVHSRADQ